MSGALEEADLRRGMSEGGAVIGALIVERERGLQYVVYVRPDWVHGRSYRLIKTWRGLQGIRVWKTIDACMSFIRGVGYSGRVTIYPAKDDRLVRIAGIWPEDGSGGAGDDDSDLDWDG